MKCHPIMNYSLEHMLENSETTLKILKKRTASKLKLGASVKLRQQTNTVFKFVS